MKALVTDNVHEVLLEDFNNAGIATTYLPKINQEEVEKLIGDFEVLIINSKINVHKDFIDRAGKLKCIGRLGSGMEIVDVVYAKEKGIAVFSSPEGNCDAVGEHAIGMILSLFNKLFQAHQDVIGLDWNREANRGEELKGKTIGIIGYGHTGKAFAKKLSGFDVEVLFYDKYLEGASDAYARQVTLKELQKKSEIISFHVPYNSETHHYFNSNFLNDMRKPFYLINTSRGLIVDAELLEVGLTKSKILGICLDVFKNEKPDTFTEVEKSWFKRMSNYRNVIFSTHVAGWTQQSKYKLSKNISEKIVTFLQ